MHQLAALLEQANQDCLSYLSLLDEEQDALINSDMQLLESLLERKTPLINQLAAHDSAIADWMGQQGLEAGTLGDFLALHAEDELRQQHMDFLEHLGRCQQAGNRNARLVAHSQHSTRHLLDLLRNQGETTQNVYNRQGLTRSPSGQRTISKA